MESEQLNTAMLVNDRHDTRLILFDKNELEQKQNGDKKNGRCRYHWRCPI